MTKNTKVLFIWDVPDQLKEYLTTNLEMLPLVKLLFPSPASEEVFLDLAQEADIIVGWRPTKELLERAEKLALFINPGAGIRHHIEPFRELNRTRTVLLANGHGNTYFTAQHAVALLLTLMNKVVCHHNWMKAGQWRKGDAEARSIPLRFRKIGLLGYGHINQKVHQFLSGFNVEFSILRRNWKKQTSNLPTPAKKYVPAEMHSFLTEIDILIVAVPETSATIGLIQMEELRLLGTEGLIVNVSRGSVIDEASLFTALKEKIIAGAAIDVWYDYRPEPDEEGKKYPYSKPFHMLDNIVLSPHRGASPMNDLLRWNEVIENIQRFATGKRSFLNIVNLDNEY
ncbi:MAG: NAD(P)-dependent oxidoreductase [Candidatus Hermodarchaeota archaeon]